MRTTFACPFRNARSETGFAGPEQILASKDYIRDRGRSLCSSAQPRRANLKRRWPWRWASRLPALVRRSWLLTTSPTDRQACQSSPRIQHPQAIKKAETEIAGKAVVLTDGKAGTVEKVWLNESHGLRISIKGHDASGLSQPSRTRKNQTVCADDIQSPPWQTNSFRGEPLDFFEDAPFF